MANNNVVSLVTSIKESHLVVSALVAAVSFTAGFTLPGGTFQEGEHQGTPILKHNAAFQVFIVTNTIALVFSSTAMLIHLVLFVCEEMEKFVLMAVASLLTVVAMASMMIAFVTGRLAMLGVFSVLGILFIFIGLLFLVPCFLSFMILRQRLLWSIVAAALARARERELARIVNQETNG